MTAFSQRLASCSPATRIAVKSPVAAETVDITGIVKSYARGQEIFGEGERADHVYKVVRGVVRCFKTLNDGRRQICDFALAGDVFGLEASDDHGMSAEAVADSAVVAARRGSVLETAADPLGAARGLVRLTMANLERNRDHVLTLGRRSAVERVVVFLLGLAERLGETDTIELPMSRQDMADYLGLTIETVSRVLTQLAAQGLIHLRRRRSVALRDRTALRMLCE
jgi:CRP/FNR family nitrogen fixation transcriptional regulator